MELSILSDVEIKLRRVYFSAVLFWKFNLLFTLFKKILRVVLYKFHYIVCIIYMFIVDKVTIKFCMLSFCFLVPMQTDDCAWKDSSPKWSVMHQPRSKTIHSLTPYSELSIRVRVRLSYAVISWPGQVLRVMTRVTRPCGRLPWTLAEYL